jgi:hypothetical protein
VGYVAREWQTPTFSLTSAGLALTALYLTGHSWAFWPAVACLAVPGIGGTAITLHDYVVRAAEEWTWQGIVRAFSKERPGQEFWRGLLTHLPQVALAVALFILGFREHKGCCREAEVKS